MEVFMEVCKRNSNRRWRLLLSVLFLLINASLIGQERPSYISEKVWAQVEHHLLPENHPIKPILDEIFSRSRATLSIQCLKKAGFESSKPRKWTHLIVTKHPDVPGYIFKLFLDAQRYAKKKPEYAHWLERIEGIMAIREEIRKRGWGAEFKTPKKWIYLLPKEPSPPKEFNRKDFILVEEDMDLFDEKSNYELWKSNLVTEGLLYKFYVLLEEVGLHDCAKPDNAPFSRDGKIAFIDTQSHHYWPVRYDKLSQYLSEPMRAYWKSITRP